MRNTDDEWEAFGKEDPYYGVVSHDQFHSVQEDSDRQRAEFFQTGEAGVQNFMDIIAQHFGPGFSPRRTLDFGCGVARLTIPLARRSGEVVGVDISDSMLREAAANCERMGIKNASFVKGDDDLSRLTGEFDFIHSYIVLQHIPVHRGEAMFEKMLSRLSTGGIGAMHFTFGSTTSPGKKVVDWILRNVPLAYNFANLVRGRPFGYPQMQMNEYDVNKLLAMLRDNSCHEVALRYSLHGPRVGAVFFFRKKALQML